MPEVALRAPLVNARLAFALALALAALLAVPIPARAHGDVHTRIDAITARIETHPADAPRLYVQRGQLREVDQDYAGAVADYESARRMDPRADPELDYYEARAMVRGGEHGRARPLLDGFLARNPDHIDALFIRARAHAGLRDPDAAACDFDRVLTLAPSPTPDTYLERADAFVRRGRAEDIERAVSGLRAGVQRLGPLAALIEAGVNAELARQRPDAAITWVDELPPALGETPRWRSIRGDLHATAGRTRDALLEWRAALRALDELPASRRNSPAHHALREDLARKLASEERAAPSAQASGARAVARAASARARSWAVPVVGAVVAVLVIAGYAVMRARRR